MIDPERFRRIAGELRNEIGKVIIGQESIVEGLLTALFAQGHCLLVGVPGLAKTLLIRSLAEALALSFSRIQFTPDLMPSDITGTDILQENHTGGRAFRFVPGPLFAHLVLADEINRTPPRTQSALLEAMQERQVTVAGVRHRLPEPFFVLATQNPIEQEGTYPLPEAQQDRFLFRLDLDYPSEAEETAIIDATTTPNRPTIEPILDGPTLTQMQATVRAVPIAPDVTQSAVKLCRSTRPGSDAPAIVNKYLAWGAGPRASQQLVLAAKARALLQGRSFVSGVDLEALAPWVLRHRLVTNYAAQADGMTVPEIVRQVMIAMVR